MVRVMELVAVVALVASCGGIEQYEIPAKAPAQPVTAESKQGIDGSEQYLADALESATSTESEADSTADVDEEVINEIAGEKAKKLAEKVLADLDADKSGSLNLEEFLAGPKKFVDKMPNLKVGAELDAKRKEKMTADFKANAGEDSLLSVDELAALLKSKAPHVACVRGKGRGGKIGHGPRGPQGRGGRRGPPPPHRREPLDDAQISEIIAKFDTDGDKVLNAAEFKEFMNARPGKVKVEVSEEVEKEGE